MRSLLLLSQEEDAYIEFLRLRNISIVDAPSSLLAPLPLSASDVTQLLRCTSLCNCICTQDVVAVNFSTQPSS
jgi:hypothetical protein